MSMEENIRYAISDLRDAILKGESYGYARFEIANDYAVKEDVLHVRFTKQHGDWSTLREREAEKVAMANRVREMDMRRRKAQAEQNAAELAAIAAWFRANPGAFGVRI